METRTVMRILTCVIIFASYYLIYRLDLLQQEQAENDMYFADTCITGYDISNYRNINKSFLSITKERPLSEDSLNSVTSPSESQFYSDNKNKFNTISPTLIYSSDDKIVTKNPEIPHEHQTSNKPSDLKMKTKKIKLLVPKIVNRKMNIVAKEVEKVVRKVEKIARNIVKKKKQHQFMTISTEGDVMPREVIVEEEVEVSEDFPSSDGLSNDNNREKPMANSYSYMTSSISDGKSFTFLHSSDNLNIHQKSREELENIKESPGNYVPFIVVDNSDRGDHKIKGECNCQQNDISICCTIYKLRSRSYHYLYEYPENPDWFKKFQRGIRRRVKLFYIYLMTVLYDLSEKEISNFRNSTVQPVGWYATFLQWVFFILLALVLRKSAYWFFSIVFSCLWHANQHLGQVICFFAAGLVVVSIFLSVVVIALQQQLLSPLFRSWEKYEHSMEFDKFCEILSITFHAPKNSWDKIKLWWTEQGYKVFLLQYKRFQYNLDNQLRLIPVKHMDEFFHIQHLRVLANHHFKVNNTNLVTTHTAFPHIRRVWECDWDRETVMIEIALFGDNNEKPILNSEKEETEIMSILSKYPNHFQCKKASEIIIKSCILCPPLNIYFFDALKQAEKKNSHQKRKDAVYKPKVLAVIDKILEPVLKRPSNCYLRCTVYSHADATLGDFVKDIRSKFNCISPFSVKYFLVLEIFRELLRQMFVVMHILHYELGLMVGWEYILNVDDFVIVWPEYKLFCEFLGEEIVVDHQVLKEATNKMDYFRIFSIKLQLAGAGKFVQRQPLQAVVHEMPATSRSTSIVTSTPVVERLVSLRGSLQGFKYSMNEIRNVLSDVILGRLKPSEDAGTPEIRNDVGAKDQCHLYDFSLKELLERIHTHFLKALLQGFKYTMNEIRNVLTDAIVGGQITGKNAGTSAIRNDVTCNDVPTPVICNDVTCNDVPTSVICNDVTCNDVPTFITRKKYRAKDQYKVYAFSHKELLERMDTHFMKGWDPSWISYYLFDPAIMSSDDKQQLLLMISDFFVDTQSCFSKTTNGFFQLFPSELDERIIKKSLVKFEGDEWKWGKKLPPNNNDVTVLVDIWNRVWICRKDRKPNINSSSALDILRGFRNWMCHSNDVSSTNGDRNEEYDAHFSKREKWMLFQTLFPSLFECVAGAFFCFLYQCEKEWQMENYEVKQFTDNDNDEVLQKLKMLRALLKSTFQEISHYHGLFSNSERSNDAIEQFSDISYDSFLQLLGGIYDGSPSNGSLSVGSERSTSAKGVVIAHETTQTLDNNSHQNLFVVVVDYFVVILAATFFYSWFRFVLLVIVLLSYEDVRWILFHVGYLLLFF